MYSRTQELSQYPSENLFQNVILSETIQEIIKKPGKGHGRCLPEFPKLHTEDTMDTQGQEENQHMCSKTSLSLGTNEIMERLSFSEYPKEKEASRERERERERDPHPMAIAKKILGESPSHLTPSKDTENITTEEALSYPSTINKTVIKAPTNIKRLIPEELQLPLPMEEAIKVTGSHMLISPENMWVKHSASASAPLLPPEEESSYEEGDPQGLGGLLDSRGVFNGVDRGYDYGVGEIEEYLSGRGENINMGGLDHHVDHVIANDVEDDVSNVTISSFTNMNMDMDMDIGNGYSKNMNIREQIDTADNHNPHTNPLMNQRQIVRLAHKINESEIDLSQHDISGGDISPTCQNPRISNFIRRISQFKSRHSTLNNSVLDPTNSNKFTTLQTPFLLTGEDQQLVPLLETELNDIIQIFDEESLKQKTEITRMESEINRLNNIISTQDDKDIENTPAVNRLENDCELYRDELNGLSNKYWECRTKLNTAQKDCKSLKNQLQLKEREVENITQSLNSTNTNITIPPGHCLLTEEEVDYMKSMLQSKDKELGGLTNLKDELLSHISNLESENMLLKKDKKGFMQNIRRKEMLIEELKRENTLVEQKSRRQNENSGDIICRLKGEKRVLESKIQELESIYNNKIRDTGVWDPHTNTNNMCLPHTNNMCTNNICLPNNVCIPKYVEVTDVFSTLKSSETETENSPKSNNSPPTATTNKRAGIRIPPLNIIQNNKGGHPVIHHASRESQGKSSCSLDSPLTTARRGKTELGNYEQILGKVSDLEGLLRKTQDSYGVKAGNYMARISELEDFILGNEGGMGSGVGVGGIGGIGSIGSNIGSKKGNLTFSNEGGNISNNGINTARENTTNINTTNLGDTTMGKDELIVLKCNLTEMENKYSAQVACNQTLQETLCNVVNNGTLKSARESRTWTGEKKLGLSDTSLSPIDRHRRCNKDLKGDMSASLVQTCSPLNSLKVSKLNYGDKIQCEAEAQTERQMERELKPIENTLHQFRKPPKTDRGPHREPSNPRTRKPSKGPKKPQTRTVKRLKDLVNNFYTDVRKLNPGPKDTTTTRCKSALRTTTTTYSSNKLSMNTSTRGGGRDSRDSVMSVQRMRPNITNITNSANNVNNAEGMRVITHRGGKAVGVRGSRGEGKRKLGKSRVRENKENYCI